MSAPTVNRRDVIAGAGAFVLGFYLPPRASQAQTAPAHGAAWYTEPGVPEINAWIELDAPQCGYCQSGMIMSALALLERNPNPTDADIDASVTNACRCSSYHRVRKAIHLAADLMKAEA